MATPCCSTIRMISIRSLHRIPSGATRGFSWTGGSVPANVPSGYTNAYMDMFSMGPNHEFRRQVIYDRGSNNVFMRRSGTPVRHGQSKSSEGKTQYPMMLISVK